MLRKAIIFLVLAMFTASLCCACSQMKPGQMKDGYYTAERIDFHPGNGWKEYVTIYVRSNKLVTIEYNAKNSSGFIKSWDMKYMYDMRNFITYPNHYTRQFASELLELYQPEGIDAITGATHSYIQFQELAKAVLAQAQEGDKTVAKVYYTLYEFEIVPSLLERFKNDPTSFEKECIEHNYFSPEDLNEFRQKYLGA